MDRAQRPTMEVFRQNLRGTHTNPAKSLSESYGGRWPSRVGAHEAQGLLCALHLLFCKACAYARQIPALNTCHCVPGLLYTHVSLLRSRCGARTIHDLTRLVGDDYQNSHLPSCRVSVSGAEKPSPVEGVAGTRPAQCPGSVMCRRALGEAGTTEPSHST